MAAEEQEPQQAGEPPLPHPEVPPPPAPVQPPPPPPQYYSPHTAVLVFEGLQVPVEYYPQAYHTEEEDLLARLEAVVRKGCTSDMAKAAAAVAARLGRRPEFADKYGSAAAVLQNARFGRDGESALNIACRWQRRDVARFLLAPPWSVDPNGRNRETGATALNQAIIKAEYDLTLIELLIDHGAHVFPPAAAADERGFTPLTEAVCFEKTWLVRWLLDYYLDNAESPAQFTAAIEHETFRDQTALYSAARDGYEEETRLLLAVGARPVVKDYARRTPVARARQRGYTRIVEMLESATAEPERVPLLAKLRAISSSRIALALLLKTRARATTTPGAAVVPAPAPLLDGPAAVAAITAAVHPALRPRARTAAEAAARRYGEGPPEMAAGLLAFCVRATLRALPEVEVDVDEETPASLDCVYYSPPARSEAAQRRQLRGVVRGVVLGGALVEELFREVHGFMFPRWLAKDELPWYLQLEEEW